MVCKIKKMLQCLQTLSAQQYMAMNNDDSSLINNEISINCEHHVSLVMLYINIIINGFKILFTLLSHELRVVPWFCHYGLEIPCKRYRLCGPKAHIDKIQEIVDSLRSTGRL